MEYRTIRDILTNAEKCFGNEDAIRYKIGKNEIAAKTRERVKEQKCIRSLEQLKDEAQAMNSDTGYPFEKAIGKDGLSFICEVKKASPSKGIIAEYFPYLDIAKDYEKAGADCISVLTETDYFKGEDRFLKEINDTVQILSLIHI